MFNDLDDKKAIAEAIATADKLSEEDKDQLFSIFMDGFGDGQESDMFCAILAGSEVAMPNIVDLMDTLAEWKKEETEEEPEDNTEENKLIDEYHEWLEQNPNVPKKSADEAILAHGLTRSQRLWLTDFSQRWEAMRRKHD